MCPSRMLASTHFITAVCIIIHTYRYLTCLLEWRMPLQTPSTKRTFFESTDATVDENEATVVKAIPIPEDSPPESVGGL